MDGYRIALIALQVAGGISFLPYPAILVANVMQIAAEGPSGLRRLRSALPYLLLSLYPIAWIGLFVWSWHWFDRGAMAAAFLASSVPAIASLAAAFWFLHETRGAATSPSTRERSTREAAASRRKGARRRK